MLNLSKLKINFNINTRKKYFFTYTVCFIIIALLVYSWYFISNRTLIWYTDGWTQHYKALIYYSKYLRSIIKELLLQHKLVIPNWDFNIGEGDDILSIMHYYAIGDPLTIFSVFFSEENMYLYYDFLIAFRMYLAGIMFSALCFESDRKNNYAVLAGAIAYSFCGWNIYVKHHPFFMNPMIYLPLLILGVEKIIKKKRPYTFIIAVALSAMCNLYFFYMLVLTTVIYVITRTVILYRKKIKEAAMLIVRIGASSLLGVALAAVIVLPVGSVLLGNDRLSEDFSSHLFYPLSYYSMLPQYFIGPGFKYYLCISFSIPILLAVFLMFYKKKQYILMKSLFIIALIISLFPTLGRAFNGFSYITNRWVWAFALICAYILALLWPSLMNLTAKEGRFLFTCTSIYFIICYLFENSQNKKSFISLCLAFILLFILIPLSDKEGSLTYKRKQLLAMFILVFSIIINYHYGNSFYDASDAGEHLETKQLTLNYNETVSVAQAAEKQGVNDFYRFSGRNLTKNANILAKMSSTQSYWSLLNPYLIEYRNKLNIFEFLTFDPTNFDDRAGLTTLASVLYYAVPQSDTASVPYGFTYVDNPENSLPYKVYRNEYALPLTYTYDNYITTDSWEALSPVEKEEVMLQSVVLSSLPTYTSEADPTLSSYELPYTITCKNNSISLQDNSFITTAENAEITLEFEAVPDSEIFFCIEGLEFKETSRYDLYNGDPALDPFDIYNDARWNDLANNTQWEIKKEKLYWSELDHANTGIGITSSNNETKSLNHTTPDSKLYAGRHDYVGSFASYENAVSSMKITFGLRGVYSFDSLKIICQPMSNYADQVEALKENTLQNMNIGTDTVTGDITLNKPSLLCFSIPYSTGWRAYVDGQETQLYQANIMHMALDLDAGSHDIKLVYRTPLLKESIYISLFGLALFITLIIVTEIRRKHR